MKGKNLFARVFLFCVTPILFLLHPVKFYGKENLPRGGGFIIASNHLMWLDPFYIAWGSGKAVNFMAKSELFDFLPFALFLKSLKAFPVKRGFFDRKSLQKSCEIIKNGEVLGIFPEGGIPKNSGAPVKAKRGIAYIAGECKCDVVPVSIYSKTGRSVFSKLTVRFAEPISFEQLKLSEDSTKEDFSYAADLIMKKISEMWGKGHERN